LIINKIFPYNELDKPILLMSNIKQTLLTLLN